jgi:hypothetical protein
MLSSASVLHPPGPRLFQTVGPAAVVGTHSVTGSSEQPPALKSGQQSPATRQAALHEQSDIPDAAQMGSLASAAPAPLQELTRFVLHLGLHSSAVKQVDAMVGVIDVVIRRRVVRPLGAGVGGAGVDGAGVGTSTLSRHAQSVSALADNGVVSCSSHLELHSEYSIATHLTDPAHSCSQPAWVATGSISNGTPALPPANRQQPVASALTPSNVKTVMGAGHNSGQLLCTYCSNRDSSRQCIDAGTLRSLHGSAVGTNAAVTPVVPVVAATSELPCGACSTI